MTWIDDNLSLIHADDAEVSNVLSVCIQKPSADLVKLANKVVAEAPCPTVKGIVDYYDRNCSLSAKQRKCLAFYIAERFYVLDSEDLRILP